MLADQRDVGILRLEFAPGDAGDPSAERLALLQADLSLQEFCYRRLMRGPHERILPAEAGIGERIMQTENHHCPWNEAQGRDRRCPPLWRLAPPAEQEVASEQRIEWQREHIEVGSRRAAPHGPDHGTDKKHQLLQHDKTEEGDR